MITLLTSHLSKSLADPAMAKKYTVGQILHSIFVWLVVAVTTAVISNLIIFFSIVLHYIDRKQRVIHSIANAWGKTIFSLNPTWHIKIQGKGYIRDNESYVLVANHSSLSDIICLYCMGKRFKWVAKESLFKIPFFGWAMSALGYIPLRRGEHGSIRESYQKSIEWLNRNMSVLYFPEGTRSKTGNMLPFKNGAFKLAIETKRPIVPIVLTGTKELAEKGSAIFSSNVHCRIRILKPIPTAHYRENECEELKNLVRSQMTEALAHLPTAP